MKLINKGIFAAVLGCVILSAVSCTDEIKFGSAFLEKAPSGDVTEDTVFNSAQYTKQFLAGIYSLQYYGLPYEHSNSFPYTYSTYATKFDDMTDCYLSNFSNEPGSIAYYTGTLNSSYGGDGLLFDYRCNNTFEAIHNCWLLIENVDRVPDMDEATKAEYKAEAKCLMAAKYFDAFKFYGGMPIIKSTFSGTDATYHLPRATVEETVNYMISLLNQAIPYLPWTVANPESDAGHWTRAGAMALKCKIWQFAASPLFNSSEGYYGGTSDAEKQHLVWYGGYKPELWDSLYNACKDFFTELDARGGYALVQADGHRPQDYCNAFRKAYYNAKSPEILHFTRVVDIDSYKLSTYAWHSWQAIGRCSTNPTFDYMTMFGWADGRPFNWAQMTDAQKDTMFTTGGGDATHVHYTRDPRLYETMLVCGEATSMDEATGNLSGRMREMWIGGGASGVNGGYNEAAFANASITEATSQFGTGLGNQKYYCNADGIRSPYQIQWCYLRLSDIYLTYAEAKLQKGDLKGAIALIDKVRARVGLEGLEAAYPDEHLSTNKDQLLNRLLQERVCELGLEDTRYFDLIRYKRADIFEQPVHKLLTYPLHDDGTPYGLSEETRWFGYNQKHHINYPTKFKYETQEVKRTRIWWTDGFDPKWYLEPWPLTEVNKGYGLVQNPGW
ncbi:MAG: RagB/SusD family nutrient uptake outer membrane protein [Prevotella sp.]|jgi:hypothetical protein|nr:RagB/SusD family nutrient uptake outer membrane protein [Prevotella sp.]MCI1473336.1 RagB/SusD family nutrient uptake outer membrane protein [Prevotella sp.]MCI1519491.1 RagB/SusD family nutrient uptake outer membrane protein [Prevotella sp.]MCI1595550.1 RagB/SusD family nutrient uptake outer membrane protein [Prevotella sp.]